MRLRLIGTAVLAPALAGCLSTGARQEVVVCDPAIVDQCVPVSEGHRAVARAPVAPPRQAGLAGTRFRLTTFSGKHFTVGYPAGWRVQTADAWNGTFLDTTIRHPRSPETFLRVDVMPGLRETDPAIHARRVEGYLRSQPGYVPLAFERTVLRRRALRWEFRVRESDVLLRKVDVFLTDAHGNGVAILTQAPAAEWDRHVELFEHLRGSLVLRARAQRT